MLFAMAAELTFRASRILTAPPLFPWLAAPPMIDEIAAASAALKLGSAVIADVAALTESVNGGSAR